MDVIILLQTFVGPRMAMTSIRTACSFSKLIRNHRASERRPVETEPHTVCDLSATGSRLASRAMACTANARGAPATGMTAGLRLGFSPLIFGVDTAGGCKFFPCI